MSDKYGNLILAEVQEHGSATSSLLAEKFKVPHQDIVGFIKSLESIGNIIDVDQISKKVWQLTEEGLSVCANGSLESQLFSIIPKDGISVQELKKTFDKSDVAMGYAFKNKWVRKDKDRIVKIAETIHDKTQEDMKRIANGESVDEKKLSEYKKRQLVILVPQTEFVVKKGPNFTTTATKQVSELTKDMIEKGGWKTATFKPYNFNARGKMEQRSGYIHPLMQLKTEFKKVFLEMGFTEMPTNNYIESAFWNFDALFQPQGHPARDAQDTFCVSDPATTLEVPKDYMEKVRKVHTVGDFGSTGYQSPWSEEEAHKNLLRTHTTAVSARLLTKLAKEGFKPVKYFSIDKVYRNETLDATHLAEFHQVEGVMGDVNLSMQDLMGTFATFFKKIGIPDIRFKPTYNPYTQPSMEIYSYHKGLKKWVEVGNSGYFRPEMLRTMGLPEDATVAGWGLSLERPAMIMYGINNIRELVGSKVKMELILDNPICTIDKFGRKDRPTPSKDPVKALCQRQKGLLDKLSHLKSKIADFSGGSLESTDDAFGEGFLDIVINVDHSRPSYGIRSLISILCSSINVRVQSYIHSSVKNISEELRIFWDNLGSQNSSPKAIIRVVWKKTDLCLPSMCVSALKNNHIIGESNICRYLCRLLESTGPFLYEKLGAATSASIDNILDLCDSVVTASNKEKAAFSNTLLKILKNHSFICGSQATLADFVALSTLRQLNLKKYEEMQAWTGNCKTVGECSVIL